MSVIKVSPTIVDTEENLLNSDKIIPDGTIVKIKNSNSFKLGNGNNKYSELPDNIPNVLIADNELHAIELSQLHANTFVIW